MAATGSTDAFDIVFYVAEDGTRPMDDYLNSCPDGIQIRIDAVAIAVAEAPPHRFSGGGMWEAMHGDMKGWYEIRIDHQRQHYRVFCLLDSKAEGRGPLLVLVDGRTKPRGTKIADKEYADIRELGELYLRTQPRPIA